MGRKKKPHHCMKEKSINHCDDDGMMLVVKQLFSTLGVKAPKKKKSNKQPSEHFQQKSNLFCY